MRVCVRSTCRLTEELTQVVLVGVLDALEAVELGGVDAGRALSLKVARYMVVLDHGAVEEGRQRRDAHTQLARLDDLVAALALRARRFGVRHRVWKRNVTTGRRAGTRRRSSRANAGS